MIEGYAFAVEDGAINLPELFPLYAEHYREMSERLKAGGLECPAFNPRVDEYVRAWTGGWLVNYVIRHGGKPVGYSNIYVTNDMHNGQRIAREDTIFVLKPHRNGVGRKFSQFILADLKDRGVKALRCEALTDLRVEKLWKRMGFKPVAQSMVYTF